MCCLFNVVVSFFFQLKMNCCKMFLSCCCCFNVYQVIKVCFFTFKVMATTACFIIVSRNDIPIYEAEVGSAIKVGFFAQLD